MWLYNAPHVEAPFAPAWHLPSLSSATLPLPDYGRVARDSERIRGEPNECKINGLNAIVKGLNVRAGW